MAVRVEDAGCSVVVEDGSSEVVEEVKGSVTGAIVPVLAVGGKVEIWQGVVLSK